MSFETKYPMREYRISKGWAIFMYITAPLLIALFCWLLVMPFVPEMRGNMSPNAGWVFVPMSLAMIVMMVIAVIDTNKGKFVIDRDRVFSVGAFSTRELMFNEIKGYRITDKYTFIEPNNENKKSIKVSKYLGNRDEIMEWLSDNYSDLDGVQAIEEKEEILSNDTFGWTTEQREEYLIKAQKVSKIVNYTGWAIGAWTLLFPNPYEYAILASIIFPIICLVVLKYFKGIITIDEKKGSAYPNIAGAILATTLALCLRGMLDFNIFDHSHVWIPAIAIAAVFIAVMAISVKKLHFKNAKDSLVLILFSVFMFAYGYGAVVTINCVYDKSEPETFNATILSKRVSSGKTKTYYLKLTPWGQRTTAEEVSVSSNLYNRVEQEDTVNIYFRKGQFNIPWFRVTK